MDPTSGSVPIVEAEGPVLAFGGCYSNLEATLAMRARADRLGIPPDRIVCTGDVVAYCADPAATVSLVREWGIHVVMGNCEESLGWGGEDCGCGFAAGSACDRLSAEWFAYASGAIDEDARVWMRGLPRRIDLRLGGRRLAVIHGALDRINRFISPSTPWQEKARQIAESGCDGIVGGHCGIPFAQLRGDRLWLNAGAIGMPANDGARHSWYGLLVPSARCLKVRIEPLHYDDRAAARKMRRSGLPEGYAAALETGLWPSCDVLPPAEVARTGRPLSPGRARWTARR